MPRDPVAIAIQVAGNRLPDGKRRRPVPPVTQTTETTIRATTTKTMARIRDATTSLSNVGSLTR